MFEYGDVRTGGHCVFVLHSHVVFVTKYRHPVFTAAHLTRVEEITRAVCADFETKLAEFNGKANHVHLLVNFPPKVALSKLVNIPRACPPAGSGRSSRTLPGTTGGRTGCGPGRTSPDLSADPRSSSCASTSSGNTTRPDRLISAPFTGLKAGALADIWVARYLVNKSVWARLTIGSPDATGRDSFGEPD
jgi:hypothetical protein